jgi:hypothetical protein
LFGHTLPNCPGVATSVAGDLRVYERVVTPRELAETQTATGRRRRWHALAAYEAFIADPDARSSSDTYAMVPSVEYASGARTYLTWTDAQSFAAQPAPFLQFRAGSGPDEAILDFNFSTSASMGGSTATNAEVDNLQLLRDVKFHRTLEVVNADFATDLQLGRFGNAHAAAEILSEDGLRSDVGASDAEIELTELAFSLPMGFGSIPSNYANGDASLHVEVFERVPSPFSLYAHETAASRSRWTDAPVILTRILGPVGMRGPGVQVAYSSAERRESPMPHLVRWIVMFQDGEDEEMYPFLSQSPNAVRFTGGRPRVEDAAGDTFSHVVLSGRTDFESWPNDDTRLLLGLSGAYGANATGPDGVTALFGADLTVQPVRAGCVRWLWISEVMGRYFEADGSAALAAEDLLDWGAYTSFLAQKIGPNSMLEWEAGLRLEYASGDGKSVVNGVEVSRSADPLRDDRFRGSPYLRFRLNENAYVRIQYDYDHAEHLPGDEAHTVWVTFDLISGTEPS